MTIDSWLLFSSIALAATLSPGPAVLLVTSHSLQYGPARAVFTILGNISGLFIMSLCSVLGLSTVIFYSTLAFTIIKTVGAVYLVYLGIKLWCNGVGARHRPSAHTHYKGGLNLYGQGIMVALTNPKAIAFTTALFPQFVEATQPLSGQFLMLVITFMAFSFLCLAGYALVSHTAKRNGPALLSNRSAGRIFGGIFILTGAALATSTNQ